MRDAPDQRVRPSVSGELAGSRLQVVVHGDHFWFAWAAFFPDTELVRLDT